MPINDKVLYIRARKFFEVYMRRESWPILHSLPSLSTSTHTHSSNLRVKKSWPIHFRLGGGVKKLPVPTFVWGIKSW